MDTYVERLEANGKTPEQGNIILGCWAIIAEDPDAEAERVGDLRAVSVQRIYSLGRIQAAGSNPAVPGC